MIAIAKRNLEIYFRDRATVVLSLMGTLMVLALYLLFLGRLWTTVSSELPQAGLLVDGWAMAGILTIVSLTSTSGAIGIMVNDRHQQIDRDFIAAPISRRDLTAGYLLSTAVVGLIMSLVFYGLAQLYLPLRGAALPQPLTLLRTLGLLALITLVNTSIVVALASGFSSHSAYAQFSGINNSLTGFIAGAYIPMGMFPLPMQWLLEPLPVFQASALMRRTMMADQLAALEAQVSAEQYRSFLQTYGFTTQYGSFVFPTWLSYAILAVTLVACFALALRRLATRQRASGGRAPRRPAAETRAAAAEVTRTGVES